jgi:hypothetical protein
MCFFDFFVSTFGEDFCYFKKSCIFALRQRGTKQEAIQRIRKKYYLLKG